MSYKKISDTTKEETTKIASESFSIEWKKPLLSDYNKSN